MIRLWIMAAKTISGKLQWCALLVMTSSYHTCNSIERYSTTALCQKSCSTTGSKFQAHKQSFGYLQYGDFDVYFLISFTGATITDDFRPWSC